jgi:hypothetical protein
MIGRAFGTGQPLAGFRPMRGALGGQIRPGQEGLHRPASRSSRASQKANIVKISHFFWLVPISQVPYFQVEISGTKWNEMDQSGQIVSIDLSLRTF